MEDDIGIQVNDQGKGRLLILDPKAISEDPEDPAFISPPSGAPVYYGFQVLPETSIDGWVLGEITSFIGCQIGDAFVVAPDGLRAGLVWEIGEGNFVQISEASQDRWGVYAVWLKRKMNNTDDIIANFKDIIPQLRIAHGNYPRHVP